MDVNLHRMMSNYNYWVERGSTLYEEPCLLMRKCNIHDRNLNYLVGHSRQSPLNDQIHMLQIRTSFCHLRGMALASLVSLDGLGQKTNLRKKYIIQSVKYYCGDRKRVSLQEYFLFICTSDIATKGVPLSLVYKTKSNHYGFTLVACFPFTFRLFDLISSGNTY